MSNNHKIVIFLTVLLLLIFGGMVYTGVDLTYRSIESKQFHSETDIKIKAEKNSFEIELKTAIPGIVLIVFGGTGLLMMVPKVPAKEMLGFQSSSTRSNSSAHLEMGTLGKAVYSKKTVNIPLPVWWLIKSKGVFVKQRGNA